MSHGGQNAGSFAVIHGCLGWAAVAGRAGALCRAAQNSRSQPAAVPGLAGGGAAVPAAGRHSRHSAPARRSGSGTHRRGSVRAAGARRDSAGRRRSPHTPAGPKRNAPPRRMGAGGRRLGRRDAGTFAAGGARLPAAAPAGGAGLPHAGRLLQLQRGDSPLHAGAGPSTHLSARFAARSGAGGGAAP